MRFRPEQHLRRQSDFRAIREQGRRLNCGAFMLWSLRREPAAATPPRIGVVASTSAVGAAVQRNRAKRRLREIFRHRQHLVPADCDLMLVARAAVTQRPMAELEQKFTEACGHLAPAPGKND